MIFVPDPKANKEGETLQGLHTRTTRNEQGCIIEVFDEYRRVGQFILTPEEDKRLQWEVMQHFEYVEEDEEEE